MKIQCNVCESAEATVLCCADEAALCWTCDQKVHAANKLASKHQRVPLSNSNNQMPKCDICQETDGYFFCLEDRALLCRKCDVAIHTANALVSAHQRFLLTGVKIRAETDELVESSSVKSVSQEKISEAAESLGLPMSANSQYNKVVPIQAAGSSDFASSKLAFGGGSSTEGIQQWLFDDFFGLTDFNQNYNHINNGSSRSDSSKMGDSSIVRALEIELDEEDRLGEVPDASWAVPQICSPPTASGLWWPKQAHYQINSAAFVPDVSYSSQQTLKRRRHM